MDTTRTIFTSPTGAEPGSERYFEEAINAGFYGVPDDESYAFTITKIAREDDYVLDYPEPDFDPFEAPECCQ